VAPSPAAGGKDGAAGDAKEGSSTPGDAQRLLVRNNSSTSSKGKW
jgi:hypothetical protein